MRADHYKEMVDEAHLHQKIVKIYHDQLNSTQASEENKSRVNSTSSTQAEILLKQMPHVFQKVIAILYAELGGVSIYSLQSQGEFFTPTLIWSNYTNPIPSLIPASRTTRSRWSRVR